MGQKVNPHGLRVGVISDWDSNWFAEEKFADYLVEDYKIREFVKKKLYSAGISKIEIERPTDKVRVIIHTAKPGFVIGKGGEEIEKLKKELAKLGFSFGDSMSNFIFATHERVPAKELFEALKKEHIFVRYFSKERISNYLRISIGTKEEMEELIRFLKNYLQ